MEKVRESLIWGVANKLDCPLSERLKGGKIEVLEGKMCAHIIRTLCSQINRPQSLCRANPQMSWGNVKKIPRGGATLGNSVKGWEASRHLSS